MQEGRGTGLRLVPDVWSVVFGTLGHKKAEKRVVPAGGSDAGVSLKGADLLVKLHGRADKPKERANAQLSLNSSGAEPTLSPKR